MSASETNDISEIIELAWDDDTSFDAIKFQTGLSEQDVIALMRANLKPRSFRLWRKRVTGRSAKHATKAKQMAGPAAVLEDD